MFKIRLWDIVPALHGGDLRLDITVDDVEDAVAILHEQDTELAEKYLRHNYLFADGELKSYTAEIQTAPEYVYDATLVLEGLDFENAENDIDEQGNRVAGIYLGSCLNIMPSGKFYMPWACSNLRPCPICKGKGNVKNWQDHPLLFNVAEEERNFITAKNAGSFFCDWPIVDQAKARELDFQLHSYGPFLQCPYCMGHGSREAYEDIVAQETLEEYASEHGFWLGGSESDGLDMFAFKIVVPAEENEDDEQT